MMEGMPPGTDEIDGVLPSASGRPRQSIHPGGQASSGAGGAGPRFRRAGLPRRAALIKERFGLRETEIASSQRGPGALLEMIESELSNPECHARTDEVGTPTMSAMRMT